MEQASTGLATARKNREVENEEILTDTKESDHVKRRLDEYSAIKQQDRDVLFENEKFVVGLLQAVSGAAIVAALSQASVLTRLTSDLTVRVFLTLSSFALLFAILAAVFKHQYKMWDVKAAASGSLREIKQYLTRSERANAYLYAMRYSVLTSAALLVASLLEVVVSTWWTFVHS